MAPSQTIAWSVDGVHFRCIGPLSDGLPLGGYVRIEVPGASMRLGQLLDQEVVIQDGRRLVSAGGILLGGTGDPAPFDEAPTTRASDQDVRAALPPPASPLAIGTLRGHAAIDAVLGARGFNRHTFLCGQSGSGKTYSLGVLLERLVLNTTLPLLVLDPNGDHVHLATPAPGTDEDLAAAYRAAAEGVVVTSAEPGPGQQPLRIHLAELGREGIGAAMELDPVADREEYNALLHLIETAPDRGWTTVQDAAEAMRQEDGKVQRALRMRLANLGVYEMAVWAGVEGRSVTETWFEDRPRGLVANTSAFGSRRERLAVTVAILHELWAHRRDRRPLLLVVDEAHDVCPAQPGTPLERIAVEMFGQIAGEGRKYGIHLLLSTQRPDKLPENVLSQCDNVLLMRVNSSVDRAELAARFSFAPAGLIDMVGQFGLGEALLAGRVAQPPVLARIGSRITLEGGSDIPTDWARRG